MKAPLAYTGPPRDAMTGNKGAVHLPTPFGKSAASFRRLVRDAARRSRLRASPGPDEVDAVLAALPEYPDIHTIIGVDMSGFGTREEQVQDHLRAALYGRLEKAFRYAGVPWPEQEWREDRGDGALLIVPFNAAAPIIDRLVPHLHAGLRGHNKLSSEEAQITLRMAVHVVVSEFIYEQVVQRGYGLIDPDSYGKLSIVNKETVTDAWLYLPSRVEAPL